MALIGIADAAALRGSAEFMASQVFPATVVFEVAAIPSDVSRIPQNSGGRGLDTALRNARRILANSATRNFEDGRRGRKDDCLDQNDVLLTSGPSRHWSRVAALPGPNCRTVAAGPDFVVALQAGDTREMSLPPSSARATSSPLFSRAGGFVVEGISIRFVPFRPERNEFPLSEGTNPAARCLSVSFDRGKSRQRRPRMARSRKKTTTQRALKAATAGLPGPVGQLLNSRFGAATGLAAAGSRTARDGHRDGPMVRRTPECRHRSPAGQRSQADGYEKDRLPPGEAGRTGERFVRRGRDSGTRPREISQAAASGNLPAELDAVAGGSGGAVIARLAKTAAGGPTTPVGPPPPQSPSAACVQPHNQDRHVQYPGVWDLEAAEDARHASLGRCRAAFRLGGDSRSPLRRRHGLASVRSPDQLDGCPLRLRDRSTPGADEQQGTVRHPVRHDAHRDRSEFRLHRSRSAGLAAPRAAGRPLPSARRAAESSVYLQPGQYPHRPGRDRHASWMPWPMCSSASNRTVPARTT